MLRNDHVEVTSKVETAMAELHAAAGVQAGVARVKIASSSSPSSSPSSGPPRHGGDGPSEPKRPRVLLEGEGGGGDGEGGGGASDMDATGGTRAPVTAAAPPTAAPFAVIDQITDGSPAHAAGLRVGDQVIAFGGVTGGSGGGGAGGGGGSSVLPRVAALLAEREGTAVSVWVLRRGQRTEVAVVPRRWEGQGLLGCHMRPQS